MGVPRTQWLVPLVLVVHTAAQAAPSPPTSAGPVPVLDRSTFVQHWRHVVPVPDEMQWRAIPWLGTLGEAVARAQAQDRPILLWAMNGHPLACT